jgi:hypothetical protein
MAPSSACISLVHRLGQERQHGREVLRVRRSEDRPARHEEVLRARLLAAGQALALDVEDLECHSSRRRDAVGQHVARAGRDAHHHPMRPGIFEHALREHWRQAVEHGQRSLQQRVALRVQTAHRVAVILGGGPRDLLDGVGQLLSRALFAGFGLLQRGVVDDRVQFFH